MIRRCALVAAVIIVVAILIVMVIGKHSMDVKHLNMALGQNGDDIMKRADFPVSRSSILTALLYRATAPDSKGIAVTLTQSGQQVQFPPARSVLFYGESDDDVGISQIDLSIKTPDKEYGEAETTQEAKARTRRTYELIWGLIDSVNHSGWQRYIAPNDARLLGSASYPLPANGIAEDSELNQLYSDSAYQLSWEQWQRIGEHTYISWQWHTPGAFLTVSYSRGAVESGWPVSSDLDIKVETEQSVVWLYGDTLQAAKMHYAEKLPEFMITRARKEAKARDLGLQILESYRNPPIGGIPIPDIESTDG